MKSKRGRQDARTETYVSDLIADRGCRTFDLR